MWKVSHTETVAAPPSAIWSRWTNVENWPKQDTTLASASIKGAFELGSTLTLRPIKSPPIRARLALVTPDVGFAYITKLPLGTLQYTHHLDEKNGQTEFTHSVAITGALFWLYAPILGRRLEQTMIAKMKRIAELTQDRDTQGAEK